MKPKSSYDAVKRSKLEHEEGWNYHSKEIPSFELRPGYRIKILPPYGGALIRFNIFHDHTRFSVYFDANDALGSVREPYWEVYHNAWSSGDDTKRFYTYQLHELLFEIYRTCETDEVLRKDYPEMYI